MHSNVRLDPEIAAFTALLRAGYREHPSLEGTSRQAAREISEIVRRPLTRGGPHLSCSEHTLEHGAGPIRLRVLNGCTEEPRPALLYLHGGGWVMFSLETHDRVMRELAARAEIAVVGIDYGLAPETRFPGQLGQIRACIDWLTRRGPEAGVDPTRMAIGGDSAGANLSVATCLGLRDAGLGHVISGMLLCYGVYDCRFDRASHAAFDGPGFNLECAEMRQFWESYVSGPDDYLDPLAVPLLADLTNLPPAFLVVAEADILCSENLEMARRLAESGVAVESVVYPGTVHSFLEAVSVARVSRRALDDAGNWLRRLL